MFRPDDRCIRVHLRHTTAHPKYVSDAIDPRVAAILEQHIESDPLTIMNILRQSLPRSILPSRKQVYTRWHAHNSTKWKLDTDPMESCRQMLVSFEEAISLDVSARNEEESGAMEGLVAVAFGVAGTFKLAQDHGLQWNEIGVDSTCEPSIVV
jgi:hypothetical protein